VGSNVKALMQLEREGGYGEIGGMSNEIERLIGMTGQLWSPYRIRTKHKTNGNRFSRVIAILFGSNTDSLLPKEEALRYQVPGTHP
jgi:hypothetical protein